MKYNTTQKTTILELFKKNPDKQYTADEVFDIVGANGCGKSTVYRLLADMCSNGDLRKYVREGSTKSVYQLFGKQCSKHIHLRCVKCGTVIHLDNVASNDIQQKIFENSKFIINESIAIIPGECIECNRR